jgi:hypothetical protein
MPLSLFGFWFPERTKHGGVVYAEKKLNKRSFVLIITILFFFFFFCRLLVLLLKKEQVEKPEKG